MRANFVGLNDTLEITLNGCALGHKGPMCAVCQLDYARSGASPGTPDANSCIECPEQDPSTARLLSAAGIFAVLLYVTACLLVCLLLVQVCWRGIYIVRWRLGTTTSGASPPATAPTRSRMSRLTTAQTVPTAARSPSPPNPSPPPIVRIIHIHRG